MLKDFLELSGATNLLNFANDFLDNFEGEHVPDLEQALKAANVNEKLAEFILATRNTGAYETKLALSSLDLPFPSTCEEELNKLRTIKDVTVSRFIIDITSFMQHAFNNYKNGFGSIVDWTVVTCLKEAEDDVSKFTHYNPRTLSLLSLCYPSPYFVIEAKHLDVEYTAEEYDEEGIVDLTDLYHFIVKKYNKMHGDVASGNMDDFAAAIADFSYIAPMWSKWRAASKLYERSGAMTGGSLSSMVRKENIVKVFSGDYSYVPVNENHSANVNYTLVTNNTDFNSLSEDRKLQISHALEANRNTFLNIVSNAAKRIHAGRQNFSVRKFDAFVAAHQDVLNPYSASIAGGSNGVNEKLIAETRNCVGLINEYINAFNDSYSNKNKITVSDFTNFVCEKVQPTLAACKEACHNKYGADADAFFERLSNFPEYSFFGVCDSKVFGGKPRTTIQYITKEVDVPRYINNYEYRFLYGGDKKESPIKIILDNIIDAQTEYLKSFDGLFRELKNKLMNVSVRANNTNASSLYSIQNSLNVINIKSVETPGRLSGLYKGTTYNVLFRRAVEDVIRTIDGTPFKESFGGVKEVLRKFISLQERYLEKAKGFTRQLLKTPKRVSEFKGIYDDRMKMSSSLTYEDFSQMEVALHKLLENIHLEHPEAEDKNTRAQVSEYLSRVKDRSQTIRNFYNSKLLYIKTTNYNTTFYKDAAIQNVLTDIINVKRDKLVYFNEVIEPALAKYRTSRNKGTLNATQIKNIETAAYLAKKQIRIEDFKKILTNLTDLLKKDTKERTTLVFQILRQIKRVFMSFGYLNYIKLIYNELEIFPRDFNWNEFAENISTLVAVSVINITNEYIVKTRNAGPPEEVSEKRVSLGQVVRDIVTRFLNFDGFLPANDTNLIKKILRTNLEFADAFEGLDIGTHDKTSPAGKNEINFVWNVFKLVKFDESILPSSSILAFTDMLKSINDNKANFDLPDEEYKRLLYKYALFVRSITAGDENSRIIASAANDNQAITRNDANGTIVINNEISSPRLSVEYRKTNRLIVDLIATENSILNSDMEIQMIYKTIDALMANVLYVVDNFWTTYYRGNLELPLNLSSAMAGGGFFDADTVETVIDASIIPEATPFYICAFVITGMYVKQYSSDRPVAPEADDVTGRLYKRPVLKQNKLSPIYPALKVFMDDHASVYSINPQQMKICIKVFNEIWNQGTGSNASKLSQAIDNYFSEINACIVFGTELETDTFDEFTTTSEDGFKEQIRTNLEELVVDIEKSISQNIMKDNLLDPKKQLKYFEETLSNAYKMILNEQPSRRLMLLKQLLANKSVDNPDVNSEFFKFMDLVISPLLICTETYYEIFSMFEYGRAPENLNSVSVVDLDKIYINGTGNAGGNSVQTVIGDVPNKSYWDLIENIRADSRQPGKNLDEMFLLFNATVVREWNRILIQNAIETYFKTNNFECPHIWNVLDIASYPTTKSISLNKMSSVVSDNTALLRQLYPHMHNATAIIEYFDNVCNEFMSDITEFLNTFISYPYISESVREGTAKAFRTWKERFNTARLRLVRSEDFDATTTNIKIGGYIAPPPYGEIRIPAFQYVGNVKGMLSSAHGWRMNYTDEIVRTLDSESVPPYDGTISLYDWVDWVIYQIAKCDKINFCIPSRFVDIVYDGELNRYVYAATYSEDNKRGSVIYQKYSEQQYYNVITQNIMLRSMHEKNKKEVDSYSQNYVASIVAVCPYILSTLMAVKASVTPDYTGPTGANVVKMMDDLIMSVKTLYNDFISRAPFVPFMAEGSGTNNNHIYGEVLDLIHRKRAEDLSSSDFTKMSWANKYFFNNIPDIAFPVYNSKNAFEAIEKYADDKIRNTVFHELYETNKQLIGKNAWMCLIAKNRNTGRSVSASENLTNMILNTMHILSECDERVITQFMRNVLSLYTAQHGNFDFALTGGMLGGGNESAIYSNLANGIFSLTTKAPESAGGYSEFAADNPFPQERDAGIGKSGDASSYDLAYGFPNAASIQKAIAESKYNYFDELAAMIAANSTDYTHANRIKEAIRLTEDGIHAIKPSNLPIEQIDKASAHLYKGVCMALYKMNGLIGDLFTSLNSITNDVNTRDMLNGIFIFYSGAIAKLISYIMAVYTTTQHVDAGVNHFIQKVVASGILKNPHPFWAFPHYAALICDRPSVIECAYRLRKFYDITKRNNANNANGRMLWCFIGAWIKNANAIAYKNANQCPELQRDIEEAFTLVDTVLTTTEAITRDAGANVQECATTEFGDDIRVIPQPAAPALQINERDVLKKNEPNGETTELNKSLLTMSAVFGDVNNMNTINVLVPADLSPIEKALKAIYLSEFVPFLNAHHDTRAVTRADLLAHALINSYGVSPYLLNVMSDFGRIDFTSTSVSAQYADIYKFMESLITYRSNFDKVIALREIIDTIERSTENGTSVENLARTIHGKSVAYNGKYGNVPDMNGMTEAILIQFINDLRARKVYAGSVINYMRTYENEFTTRNATYNAYIYLAIKATGRPGTANHNYVTEANAARFLNDIGANVNEQNKIPSLSEYAGDLIEKLRLAINNAAAQNKQISTQLNDHNGDGASKNAYELFMKTVAQVMKNSGNRNQIENILSEGRSAITQFQQRVFNYGNANQDQPVQPNQPAQVGTNMVRIIADINQVIESSEVDATVSLNFLNDHIKAYMDLKNKPIDYSQALKGDYAFWRNGSIHAYLNGFDNDPSVKSSSKQAPNYTVNDIYIDKCRKYYALFYECYAMLKKISTMKLSDNLAKEVSNYMSKFKGDIFTDDFPAPSELYIPGDLNYYFIYRNGDNAINGLGQYNKISKLTSFCNIILTGQASASNIFRKMIVKSTSISRSVRVEYAQNPFGNTAQLDAQHEQTINLANYVHNPAAAVGVASSIQVAENIKLTDQQTFVDGFDPIKDPVAANANPPVVGHIGIVAEMKRRHNNGPTYTINGESANIIKSKIDQLVNLNKAFDLQTLVAILAVNSNRSGIVRIIFGDLPAAPATYHHVINTLTISLATRMSYIPVDDALITALNKLISLYIKYLNNDDNMNVAYPAYLYALFASIKDKQLAADGDRQPAGDNEDARRQNGNAPLNKFTDANIIRIINNNMPDPPRGFTLIKRGAILVIRNALTVLRANDNAGLEKVINLTNYMTQMLASRNSDLVQNLYGKMEDIEAATPLAGGAISGGVVVSAATIYEVARKVGSHPYLKAVYKATSSSSASPNLGEAATAILFNGNINDPIKLIESNTGYYFPLDNGAQGVFNIEFPGNSQTLFAVSQFTPEVHRIYLGPNFGERLGHNFATRNEITKYFYSPCKDMYVATIYSIGEQEVDVRSIIITYSNDLNHIARLTLTDNRDVGIAADALNDENASLSTYIKMFVPDMIRTVTSNINPKDAFEDIISATVITQPVSSGFDLGITGGLLGELTGGAKEVENFINIGKITGLNIVEKMLSAYSIGESNKNIIEGILDIRTNLFGKTEDPENTLYGLIMKYFRKRNIQMSSVYNHIIFPNIIYGSAIFRYGIKKIRDTMNELMARVTSTGQSTLDSRRFESIRQYLDKIVTNNGFNTVYRFTNTNARENRFEAAYTDPTDIHTSLSLVDEQIKEFISVVEKEDEDNTLFSSNLPNIVQQFDMIATVITMVFLIVKETGIYDPTQKRTKSVIQDHKGDPFTLAH